eukprot:symbB.v1.2.003554.t1/scaffold204.1/size273638/3
MPTWIVVGGADKGGILVRHGQARIAPSKNLCTQRRTPCEELSSAAYPERLSTGAEVEQLHLSGDRLHYQKITGTGPKVGPNHRPPDLLKKTCKTAVRKAGQVFGSAAKSC